MPIEHEAKILGADHQVLESDILGLGGTKVAERLMRRYVYDIEPGDTTRWVRLRDTGTEVTLATKWIEHDGIDGTHETEVSVSGFEATNTLLNTLGFIAKAYQENRRVSYRLEGTEIELDTWPMIPPYMEIEAKSQGEVVRVAEMLGFDEADLTGENTTKIYARYGVDLASITDLRF